MPGSLIFTAVDNNTTDLRYVKGITIDPSAGSWVCVITDGSGNVKFSARGSDAVSRSFPLNEEWNAPKLTTATNLTRVKIELR